MSLAADLAFDAGGTSVDRLFSGLTAEFAVGEIRALRTFRLDAVQGTLLPVYVGPAWVDGTNYAVCRRAETTRARSSGADPGTDPAEDHEADSHQAPDEGCSCGFYAYGHPEYATTQEHFARQLLAVTASSGVVIAGTRGIRAEAARIEALWLGPRIDDDLARSIAGRYPSVAMYRDRAAMLADHPLTRLESYLPWPTPAMTTAWCTAMSVAVGTGLIPGSSHRWLAFPVLLVAGLQLLLTVVTLDIYRRAGVTIMTAASALWALSALGATLPAQVGLRLPLVLAAMVVAGQAQHRRRRRRPLWRHNRSPAG